MYVTDIEFYVVGIKIATGRCISGVKEKLPEQYTFFSFSCLFEFYLFKCQKIGRLGLGVFGKWPKASHFLMLSQSKILLISQIPPINEI